MTIRRGPLLPRSPARHSRIHPPYGKRFGGICPEKSTRVLELLLSKFIRPETPARGEISDRDLDILATVLRYRFSSAAQLVRLVGGNEDVTHRHLRRLWEWQVINRFAFPGIRTHSEFFYYLDNRQALE